MNIPARTSINQAVAATVFVVISYYAWQKDMIFKPDPAVPMRLRGRRTGDGMYLLPTHPAVYIASDDAYDLQAVYDEDGAALQNFRLLAHHMLGEQGVWQKKAAPQLVDVGSPLGSWTVFGAAVGLYSFGIFPRRNDFDKGSISLNFNFPRTSLIGRAPANRALAPDRASLIWDGAKKNWIHPENEPLQAKEVISASTWDDMVAGRTASMFLHIGVHAQLVPTLKAALGATHRPQVVLADFTAHAGAPLAFATTTGPPSDAAVKSDLTAVLQGFVAVGYALKVLPSPGCPLSSPHSVNVVGVDMMMMEADPAGVATFAESIQTAAARAEGKPAATCRFVIHTERAFVSSHQHAFALLGVLAVLVCVGAVVHFLLKRRRKPDARSL